MMTIALPTTSSGAPLQISVPNNRPANYYRKKCPKCNMLALKVKKTEGVQKTINYEYFTSNQDEKTPTFSLPT